MIPFSTSLRSINRSPLDSSSSSSARKKSLILPSITGDSSHRDADPSIPSTLQKNRRASVAGLGDLRPRDVARPPDPPFLVKPFCCRQIRDELGFENPNFFPSSRPPKKPKRGSCD
ncbi:uncharacterized protein A4U43_C07F150 [Asparagus officinalis]|uniref:Uncharacterized protein n=1 Tax=Asparagus officinalis TaxID=4686 RepID=A0A5P1ED34_ASPOF|nr:uncharacterized protein A4U43_C07F150 [Asparagus officinalis]